MLGTILSTIYLLIGITILILLYRCSIGVYLGMRSLQKSFNVKSKIIFRPIVGLFGMMKKDSQLHGDEYYVFYNEARKDPELKIIITNIFATPVFIVLDPDLIKEILVTNHDKYIKFSRSPISFRYLFGRSLIVTFGEKWKQQRKCLGVSFSFEKLESSLPIIQKVIDEKFDDLRKRLKDDSPVALVSEMGQITAEVVVRFFFKEEFTGKTINGNSCAKEVDWLVSKIFNEERKLKSILKGQFLNGPYFALKPWTLSDIQKEALERTKNFNKVIFELIEKQKEILIKEGRKEEDGKSFESLLTILLEQHIKNPPELPFEEIIHQFIMMYFAGMDTTANWAAMAIYCLAKYPECYKKLLSEIQTQLKPDEPITNKMFGELKYLNAFLKEVLRIYSPAPTILPRKCEIPHFFAGARISKGIGMVASLVASMKSDEHFPDSETFNPERWMNENNLKIWSYIPFSAGPRNCIGQHLSTIEAKMILINFVRRFEVKLNEKVNFKMVQKTVRTVENDELVFVNERK